MCKGRVLVVEDYEDLREQLCVALRLRGFEPIAASDGREAVDVYRKELREGRNFDFAVLDYMLPFGYGDVVAADITEQAKGRGVAPPKMVAWSGSKDELMNARLQAANVHPLFLKGGDPDDLLDFLEMRAGKKNRAAA